MKRSAFTLAECLVSLIVVSWVVVILSGLMSCWHHFDNSRMDEPLDWCLCLQELESADHQFSLVRVSRYEVRLHSRETNKDYLLKPGRNLYLTKVNGGGYLPLFDDIKFGTVSFQRVNDEQLLIRGQRKNGQSLEGMVKFE